MKEKNSSYTFFYCCYLERLECLCLYVVLDSLGVNSIDSEYVTFVLCNRYVCSNYWLWARFLVIISSTRVRHSAGSMDEVWWSSFIEGLWIARMPADHAWRTIAGADEMKWNEMNEMSVEKEWNEIYSRRKLTQAPFRPPWNLLVIMMSKWTKRVSQSKFSDVQLIGERKSRKTSKRKFNTTGNRTWAPCVKGLTLINIIYFTTVLQLRSETVAAHRRMNMILDDYDGQMILGKDCGPNFLIFVLRLRKKTWTRILTRPGNEPHPLRER